MSRAFNFSAGPAMLPESVMQQAQEELMDWHGRGVSIMEMSHRCKDFMAVADATETALREALQVPDNYRVLFLHGGAAGQFAAIPMNLMSDFSYAAYVQTGIWSKIAVEEADRFTTVKVVANSEQDQYTVIPDEAAWGSYDDAAYLYYTDNETVHGIEFPVSPQKSQVPLVADMSSNLLTRPVNVSDFGLIFACSQKNLGPAGMSVVIVRDDLLSRKKLSNMPSIFDYSLQSSKGSMLNTPATFPWYMIGLVVDWVKEQGGLKVMDQRAKARSQPLYDYIDQTEFYSNSVNKAVRSRINVIFTLSQNSLEDVFLKEAAVAGMPGLKGHRSLGGVRASMYNAMPQKGADCLLSFMKDFEKRHG
jgi:phosphoserine aminotransferase